MASTAPRRVHVSAAAALATRSASSTGAPAARQAARAPLKASPAPTVSIASTGKADTLIAPDSRTATAPGGAQRHHDGGDAASHERPARGLGIVQAPHLTVREEPRLDLVGREVVYQREEIGGKREDPRRRGVEHRALAEPAGLRERPAHRVDRRLQLKENDLRSGQEIRVTPRPIGRQTMVRPRGDGDLVASRRVDRDQRDPGRRLGRALDRSRRAGPRPPGRRPGGPPSGRPRGG